ncbi:MAG: RNA polymerase sigma factor [Acidimicrobiales bacterium]
METTRDHVQASTPDHFEFERWLRDARDGGSRGFTALYEWLGPEVKRFAVGRGARDADTVTNDAFLGAFGQLASFEGDARAFRAWVFAIARNRLIDQYRAEQRRPPVAHEDSHGDRAAPSAEALALAGLGSDRVATLLASLTDAQHEVVVLRLAGGLSLEETAEIVGRPVTAVKRLQARALDRLRRENPEKAVS